MNISASKKRWVAAALCLLLTLCCACASAQSYKLGDEADEIATIQTALTTLKLYTGSITGHYGEKTQAAVQIFQKKYALTADGIAGEDTIKALYEAAGIDAAGSASSSSSSSGETALLRYGSQNEAVRQLQQDLTTLGYYTGSLTGNFGDKTQAAVIAYQKTKGLTADGIVGSKTLAAIAADLNKNTSSSSGSSSSGSSSSSSLAQRASQVIFSNYSNWGRNYENGELCTVYDFETGYSWTLRIMSKDKHMDAEPATAQDTAIMNKAFGNKQTWTPKVVWVTFSDGKTYIGSTHNVPHTPYHITTNNFDGHLCVHFPRPMADAEATGPYAVSHQEAILAGWEATKKLMQ